VQIEIESKRMEGDELARRKHEWSNDGNPTHWHVTLRRTDTGASIGPIDYSMGSAHRGPPSARDVLGCLLSDVESVVDRTFEEFCSDLGFDEDSRRAERAFKSCCRIDRDMHLFLGSAEMERFSSIGADEYARILFDGEDIKPRHGMERVLPWREFEEDGVRKRVCLSFGVDLEFAKKHTQDPYISTNVHVQEWRPSIWITSSSPSAENHLPGDEQRLLLFRSFGVLTGPPLHYVPNSLYMYEIAIGFRAPVDLDVARWRRENPESKSPVHAGAYKTFLRCCAFGVVDPEPRFPMMVVPGSATPLPMEELIENMKGWLEQRSDCLRHSVRAAIEKVGLPVEEILAVAEQILERRAEREARAPEAPRPRLLHTVGEEDVGKKTFSVVKCSHCGSRQANSERFPVVPKRVDIGRRVYSVPGSGGRPPYVSFEDYDQFQGRMIRREMKP